MPLGTPAPPSAPTLFKSWFTLGFCSGGGGGEQQELVSGKRQGDSNGKGARVGGGGIASSGIARVAFRDRRGQLQPNRNAARPRPESSKALDAARKAATTRRSKAVQLYGLL